jgi:hypothetical protein
MYIKVKPQSTYANLNNKWLLVKEMAKDTVTIITEFAIFGNQTLTFSTSDIAEKADKVELDKNVFNQYF